MTAFTTILSVQIDENYKKQMQEIKELKILIEKRTLRDSLYLEHMKECAFISREDIAVGHQGYLYSKYFRNNIK